MSVTRPLAATLALAAICALYLAILSGRVAAQPPARVEALARVTVAEAGFEITDDHSAITHLLTRRAARLGLTPRRMAHRYSARHFDPRRADRRRWIAGLRLGAERPAGWGRLPWSRYRPRWLAVIAHVRAALRGEVADPCPSSDHWGAQWLRRESRGWVEVDCGVTLNAYWRVSRRET